MKRVHITDLTAMVYDFNVPTGLSFRERNGICFCYDGLYRYIVCVKIWRSNGAYAIFSEQLPPEAIGMDIVNRYPGIGNPTEATWKGTTLRFAFAEQHVTYRWFG